MPHVSTGALRLSTTRIGPITRKMGAQPAGARLRFIDRLRSQAPGPQGPGRFCASRSTGRSFFRRPAELHALHQCPAFSQGEAEVCRCSAIDAAPEGADDHRLASCASLLLHQYRPLEFHGGLRRRDVGHRSLRRRWPDSPTFFPLPAMCGLRHYQQGRRASRLMKLPLTGSGYQAQPAGLPRHTLASINGVMALCRQLTRRQRKRPGSRASCAESAVRPRQCRALPGCTLLPPRRRPSTRDPRPCPCCGRDRSR